MNIARTQRSFTDLATDMAATQDRIQRLRDAGTAPTLEINTMLDTLAHRLDDARVQYLRAFPSGTVTADRLREDEISIAARAGCAKFLAKHEIAFPTDASWDAPLASVISDVARATAMLSRA